MSNATKAILAIALLAVTAAVFYSIRPNNNGGALPVTQATQDTQDRLELARTALAETENLNTEAAGQAWTELNAKMPANRSITLNRALNQVLQVDSLTESANNSLFTAEQRQAARSKLPGAIDSARSAIKDYEQASSDAVTSLWLASRVDLREASLLPATMGKSLRKELFERLAAAIQGDVGSQLGSIILGGPFIEVLDAMEDPIKGFAPDVQTRAAETLASLSKQHPQNLFVALRTARANIAAKKPEAADAVERTKQLAAAIEPSVRAQTQPIGLTPDQLVDKILAAIKDGQWPQADNQMLLWFNVLNGTELVKTDRRRTSPHPLDRLSFEALRELSNEVSQSQPAVALSTALSFQANEIDAGGETAGAIALDFDLDLDADVITVTNQGTITAYCGEAGKSWSASGTIDLQSPTTGMIAADLFMVDSSDSQRIQAKPAKNEDGSAPVVSGARHTSLASLVVFGDEGVKLVAVDGRSETGDDKRLSVVATPTGLEDVKQVNAAIAGDLDGDGDLDLLFATRDRGLRTFVNRGNRTFFEAGGSETSDLAKQTGVVSLAIVDLDRDLDLDIVTVDASTGKVGLVENLLHLQFRFRDLDVATVAGAHDVVVGDFDGNVSWDLFVTGSSEAKLFYSQTAAAGAWTAEETKTVLAGSGTTLVGDYNNDSWQEILVGDGKAATVGQIVGPAVSVSTNKVVVALDTKNSSAIDFDLDGKLDVLSIADGRPIVYLNQSTTTGHYVDVRFKGIDDNNANSGRVNHYAIGSVVELRFGPHYRAQTITSPMTHFGLNEFSQAGSMRVIFPNGLTQTIRDPKVDTLVEEEQTLKGSCPYLYAWDGEKYAFVTDCLWAAPLGLQVAQGVVAKDRPWEYLKVDGDFLRPKGSRYELRITEELWEVAYFDHVALTAVDHPADVQVWTNEKVGPAEIAEQTIFAFRSEDRHALQSGVDTYGNDVTTKLANVDQDFVQGFDRRICQGLCPPHWVDMDFGKLPQVTDESGNVYLVMTGWILPTDTSLNIQIDQNPEVPSIEFPSVWVPDSSEENGWRKAIPFMGFPGGKTKTIVVDVTDVIDRDDARLRVRTSAQMYWDHAELAIQSQPAEFKVTQLPLLDASLVYRGFSKRVKQSPTVPETYDYSSVTTAPKWPPLQGRLTSLGEAIELVEAWDDSMVVMSGGDELQLEFAVPREPVPEGWKRDFVLHCVGWDKDADLNTLTGQSSEPLPFKAMTTYPPTLDQATDLDRVDEINADRLQRTQSFRKFWAR